jgi:hypothetical protein
MALESRRAELHDTGRALAARLEAMGGALLRLVSGLSIDALPKQAETPTEDIRTGRPGDSSWK